MNIIEIKVGNKKYKISCKDGEEEHIEKLSKKFDERYKNLSAKFGHKADDSLLLVISGIVLEDEIHSLKSDKISDSKSRKIVENAVTRIDKIIEKLES